VTRATASAATNATAHAERRRRDACRERVALGSVQNVRRVRTGRAAIRARRHPLGREDGREDAVQRPVQAAHGDEEEHGQHRGVRVRVRRPPDAEARGDERLAEQA
jgi:hypothetical protein